MDSLGAGEPVLDRRWHWLSLTISKTHVRPRVATNRGRTSANRRAVDHFDSNIFRVRVWSPATKR